MSQLSIASFFKPKKVQNQNEEVMVSKCDLNNKSPRSVLEDNSSVDSQTTKTENINNINSNKNAIPMDTIQLDKEVNNINLVNTNEEDEVASNEDNEVIDDEFRKWAATNSGDSKTTETSVETNHKNMVQLVNKAVTFVEEMQKQFDSDDTTTGVIKQPKTMIGGKLLPYQLQGIDWMRRLFENGSHGMLADEMGLGKTLQVIGLFAFLREAGVWGPVLIIAPLSTLGNWINEFHKWCPSINVIKYHGTREERKNLRKEIEQADTMMANKVIVTSYEMVRMDSHAFSSMEWFYIVIDEGHRLKNNECQLMQCLFTFAHSPNTSRLILTGTPLQNNLKELWSLMHFLLPDVFNSAAEFLKWFDFNNSESDTVKADIVNTLRKVISPFFLRRVKSDIDVYLPPKKEIVIYCEMTAYEKELYDIVCSQDGRYEQLIQSKHLQLHSTSRNFRMQILRQLISHPYNVYEESAINGDYVTNATLISQSSKLSIVDTMLQEFIKNQHRVLIFVQFIETLHLLEDYCIYKHWKYCSIHGTVIQQEREDAINTFNSDPSIPIFLLTTRSGGLGINLSSADTVILYDSDWNPQQDLQAMDRVHRIGQKKSVAIYRLITLHTLDMHLLHIADEKRKLERIVTHHDKHNTRLGYLSFEQFLELSKSNALAGDPGTKAITSEQAKQLATIHATGKLPEKGDGYLVVQYNAGNSILGSVNEDGKQVGKRGRPKKARVAHGPHGPHVTRSKRRKNN